MNGTLNSTDFDTFSSQVKAAGFDEALIREWAPNAVIPTHSHPFDAHAVVTQGEMWLGRDGKVQHLLPGDTFELPRGTPHDERYGVNGAVYWVARRNSAPG